MAGFAESSGALEGGGALLLLMLLLKPRGVEDILKE